MCASKILVSPLGKTYPGASGERSCTRDRELSMARLRSESHKFRPSHSAAIRGRSCSGDRRLPSHTAGVAGVRRSRQPGAQCGEDGWPPFSRLLAVARGPL